MLTIATCSSYPELPANLEPLRAELSANGIQTEVRPWQEITHAEWVLPLCAWDYTCFPQQFSQWLATPQRFVNSPSLMRWNMHKSYLCNLAKQNIEVIPTEMVTLDSTAMERIASIVEKRKWHEFVLKPAIGQSGNGVMKLKQGEALPELSAYQQAVVIQPYIAEVAEYGESSLVFFNGTFSHAVRRQPPKGEWRANSRYNVEIIPFKPAQHIIEIAQGIIKSLPEIPIYARVDGTIIQQHFLLNELELIEPALYLHTEPQAISRFSAQLTRLILGETK